MLYIEWCGDRGHDINVTMLPLWVIEYRKLSDIRQLLEMAWGYTIEFQFAGVLYICKVDMMTI